MASEKYGPSLGENHGYISPNDGKHPSESSLSIPIRNVMADIQSYVNLNKVIWTKYCVILT